MMTRTTWGALFGLGALLLSGCAEKKPQDVAMADGVWVATLPAGWSSEETSLESGSRYVKMSAASSEGEGVCLLFFIPAGDFSASDLLTNFSESQRKEFNAGPSSPVALATNLGELEGARYVGKIPATGRGVVGFLGSLAGDITTCAYAGKQGTTAIVLQVSTFSTSTRPGQFKAACEGVAKSLRPALRDGG